MARPPDRRIFRLATKSNSQRRGAGFARRLTRVPLCLGHRNIQCSLNSKNMLANSLQHFEGNYKLMDTHPCGAISKGLRRSYQVEAMSQ